MKHVDLNHLRKNKISYLSHFKKAIRMSLNMILGGTLCFIHAFIPFIFVESGSDKVKKIYWEIIHAKKN